MDSKELAEKLIGLAREGAWSEAVGLMSMEPDPEVAAAAMSAVVNALYRSDRDVPNMLVAAHLGAAWCLGQATLLPEPAKETLRRRARAMCFNAAANCWPGWGDEGVAIEDGHVAAARGLAGLCRELTQGLGLGAEAQGTSHWLVGAIELAIGNLKAARAAFGDAERSYAALGEDAPQTLMIRAYDALAARREVESDNARLALEQAVQRLDALGTEDSQFFAAQVRKADHVFVR